jgi:glutamyl-tRNA synthetase
VIRGADHHPNTPLQVALYRALDVPPPAYAHVPLIMGESGKKLSKRRDNVSIQQFRNDGYLHEALVNWLVRLGWSHGDDEIFSLADVARLFDLESVGRSAARAEIAKLDWLNQHYIKELGSDDLFARVRPHLERVAGGPVTDTPALRKLLDLLRERSRTLADMADRAVWQLRDEITYDAKAVSKFLVPEAVPLLRQLRDGMAALPEWNEAALSTLFEDVAAANGALKMGKLAQPVRVTVTGTAMSPGIYETLEVVGRDRVLARMGSAIEMAEATPASPSGD